MLNPDFNDAIDIFNSTAPNVDYWAVRFVSTRRESWSVRQGTLQPPAMSHSMGAFISVVSGNGTGYAATNDLSKGGMQRATEKALQWAQFTRSKSLVNPQDIPVIEHTGEYETPVVIPWDNSSPSDKILLLQDTCAALKTDDRIVDWSAWLGRRQTRVTLLTSAGGNIEQCFHYVSPGLAAIANNGAETQKRSGGGAGEAAQGGLEQLDRLSFPGAAAQVADEAIQLLDAPQCPEAQMDLLLMPSQMVLQIHESIGHPLEMDRILGDERNYAGTSFVTADMFGSFRYGSDLLNITFDPEHSEQLASYAWDDEGSKAERSYIIKDGILLKPLGGACSQSRSKLPGVANSRACSWNRPPIDRMANLNLEPGQSSFDQLVSGIEEGVMMQTNKSWSIDDSRNKFQFGCEFGRLIRDGEIKGIVKNPNYRGISRNFWMNLSAVGNRDTFELSGTPNCGKGEPNQVIHVGHASPACVFSKIDVFGGN